MLEILIPAFERKVAEAGEEWKAHEPRELPLTDVAPTEMLRETDADRSLRAGAEFMNRFGVAANGSGLGFGNRELRYYFLTEDQLREMTLRAEGVLREMGIPIGDVPGMAIIRFEEQFCN